MTEAAASANRVGRSRWSMPSLLLASVPTIIAVAVVCILMAWRIPTRVEMELTVSRAQFVVASVRSKNVSVLGPVTVGSLTVENFAAIVFEPDLLQVTDSDDIDVPGGASAWKNIDCSGAKCTLVPAENRINPAVTFESAGNPGESVGRLEAVRVASGSAVTLESSGNAGRRLSIRVDSGSLGAIVNITGPVQVFADHATMNGDRQLMPTTGSVVYRARLRSDSPQVEVMAAGSSLVLSFALSRESADSEPLLSSDGILVSTLDFTELSDVGARISSVRGEGYVEYPDHPEIARVPIRSRDFVGLETLEKFYLAELTTDSTNRWMRLRLTGVADSILTSSGEITRDRRLSAFDVLWRNPRLAVLFSVILWAFPTTLGALRVYRDLKGK